MQGIQQPTTKTNRLIQNLHLLLPQLQVNNMRTRAKIFGKESKNVFVCVGGGGGVAFRHPRGIRLTHFLQSQLSMEIVQFRFDFKIMFIFHKEYPLKLPVKNLA